MIIVTYSDDEDKYSEDRVDLELRELREKYFLQPPIIPNNVENGFGLDNDDLSTANDSNLFNVFPPPPSFCNGLPEGSLRLLCATMSKLKFFLLSLQLKLCCLLPWEELPCSITLISKLNLISLLTLQAVTFWEVKWNFTWS